MSVPRGDVLKQIKSVDPSRPRVSSLCGELGSGRTWLLKQLESSGGPGPRPVFVPMEEFDPGQRGEGDASASVGSVQANFNAFARLLEHLVAKACPRETRAAMARAIQKARNDEVLAGRMISLDLSLEEEVAGPVSPQDFAQSWRSAAQQVGKDFTRLWDPPSEGCVLLLDDIDRLAGQEIGGWLAELLSPLPANHTNWSPLVRTLVVISRSQANAVDGPPRADVSWTIGNFSRDEVGAYLRDARQGAGFELEIVDKVFDITDGHPATLRLVHELIWGPTLGHEEPLLVLRDLTRQRDEQRAAALVERLVSRRGEPGLMRAIQAAAVPRRFDSKLLAALLEPATPDGPAVDPAALFTIIRDLPFTERVPAPENKVVLRIHEYVRMSVLARMQAADTNGLEQLHVRAARYYQGLLERDFQDSTGKKYRYGSRYFVEHPEWQLRKREWLFHAAQLSDSKQRHATLLELASLFLTAFWWWGNYVHFDFCDQLLADIEQLVAGPEDSIRALPTPEATNIAIRSWPKLRLLHRALSEIVRSYPTRSAKWSEANWEAVRGALLDVEDACGLSTMPSRPTARQRDISGLLHIFLAHTWRYQAPSSADPAEAYREAEAMYLAADQLFSGVGQVEEDDWNRAWIAFERADMNFARRAGPGAPAEPLQAQRLWRMAADLVQPKAGPSSTGDEEDESEVEDSEEPDHELMSNLHRLRADELGRKGEPRKAATCYGRAVLHSYLFHVIGGPPDEYTLQFYVDIRARAINFLKALLKDHQLSLAVECAVQMWMAARRTSSEQGAPSPEVLQQLLLDTQKGTAVPLALALFPRGPFVEELGLEQSPFTDLLRPFRKRVGPGIHLDLHEDH